MNNYLRKIGALLMTVIMIVTMCTAVFAADSETTSATPLQPAIKTAMGTENDSGVITVQGIKKELNESNESKIKVFAYQIVKADYDKTNGNFTGYSQVYQKADGTKYISDITKANANELAALAQVVKSKDLAADTKYEMHADTTGETYKASVPVGSYLILVEGSEAVSYNVAVVSVFYTNSNGSTIITEGKVSYLSQGNTWVKRNDKPNLTKKIVDGSKFEDHNSANIGDTVKYQITIDPIPDYRGKYPRLNVEDKLSKGFTYKEGSLKISVVTMGKDGKEKITELVEKVGYEKDINKYDADKGTTIKIDFVKRKDVEEPKYLLSKEYAGGKIIIEYSAILNENAQLNEKGNENSATLNYSKDSNTEGADSFENKKTYTYTFDIRGSVDGNESLTDNLIVKTGENQWTKEDGEDHVETDKKPLEGAEFTLYTDPSCTEEKIYTNRKENGETYFNGVTTSDAKGQFKIYGLAFGTYYLKETKAPGNYTLNSHVFKIEIVPVSWNTDEKDPTYGSLTEWSIKIDNITNTFKVDNGTVEINNGTHIVPTEIKNTKTSTLPSTGGAGTYLFTIVGVMIMAAVAGMFLVSRRKDEDKR